ncbi:MAG TPA: hypothetical protein PLV13_07125 [Ilumatobacteraceae bacterium]|nr:hypothetical protein [Ilumatobacteraceae bacterium]
MAKTVRDGLVEMIDRALGDDPRQALMAAALARREGFDWGRIGRNLGLTRQVLARSSRPRHLDSHPTSFVRRRPTATGSARSG